MKDIFTDLYKRVARFFQTASDKESTKEVGYNRLKLVLMQDRTNLTPFLLERMRGEMIDVLSKYVEMDKEALELSFEHEGEQMALMLSIPVLRAKDEDEIKAIIEEEEKAKKEKEESEETENVETETESEVEETDEDVEDNADEEVCACSTVDEESSKSPDEIDEVEEEPSAKKSRKKN